MVENQWTVSMVHIRGLPLCLCKSLCRENHCPGESASFLWASSVGVPMRVFRSVTCLCLSGAGQICFLSLPTHAQALTQCGTYRTLVWQSLCLLRRGKWARWRQKKLQLYLRPPVKGCNEIKCSWCLRL